MKKAFLKTILICLFVAACSINSYAFGIGMIFGNPTGLSFKTSYQTKSSIDAAAAWNLIDVGFHIHADYLINITQLADNLPMYVGLGGRLTLWSDNDGHNGNFQLGLRVPLGLEWTPEGFAIVQKQLGVFFEVVPVMVIIPSVGFDWDAAIGLRIYL